MIRILLLFAFAFLARYMDVPGYIVFVAGWASVTYTFSASTTIKSAEVNQNFADLVAAIDKAMPSNVNGHGIIMWSGAIANIPTGWYLCDGSNSTPDLRDDFVLGAGGAYAVGATGGEINHTLTTGEMPSHSHGFTTGGQAVSTGANAHGSSTGTSFQYADITSTGGGGSHNNMPPYQALAFIMKS